MLDGGVRWAAAAALASGWLALVVACGEDRSGATPESADASSPSQTESSATSEVEIPAPTKATFDKRLEIADSPDWLAAGFGSVWVKRDNGAVERVSPEGEVQATIDADIFQQPVCQGIGVSEAAVWACATGGTLIRIDPATNDFTQVDVPKINDQGRLSSHAGLLWLLTGDGDRLEGLSDQGRVDESIGLGTFCTDTSDLVSGGVLWIACAYEGKVLQVDLEDGEVVGEVADLPGSRSVSVSGDVWVGYDEGLARVDPETLEVAATLPLDVVALRAGSDGVWVRSAGDAFLTHVTAGTGEVTTRLGSPELTSGGDVVEAGGRQWVSAYDDGVLVRVR